MQQPAYKDDPKRCHRHLTGSVTVVGRAGVDAGAVHAVVVRVPNVLTLVAQVSGTAEPMSANNTCGIQGPLLHKY